jgi:dolichol-phosphate mannosyltransferase
VELSIIIPAKDEAGNLARLLPELAAVLADLSIEYEILVVSNAEDVNTRVDASNSRARTLKQAEPGYGGALLTGFAAARGSFILTMDADLSHRPSVVRDLWEQRATAEVIVASRYVSGGSAEMPILRLMLSRILNRFFARGLSLPVRDLSSGFRLYRADLIRTSPFRARDFDLLQEMLVRLYCDGWRIREIPFDYRPRKDGRSKARVVKFGIAYLRTFWTLWRIRNSILSADYDDRAYDSVLWPQRWWQRSRLADVTALIGSNGPVLDVGSGSSRIIGTLPPGSVAVDILLRKLRYARRFSRPLVQATVFALPFQDASFPCVLCSQVIEHVAREPQLFDELARVLAPEGLLVVGTPDYGSWQWPMIEWLYARLAPGGYADEHITHYSRVELLAEFMRRGFVLEAERSIVRAELTLAFRKGRSDSFAGRERAERM